MGVPADKMAANGSKMNGTPSSNAAKYNLASHFIGANHLGVAPPSKVKDFVAEHGGHTVITNVRASNNWQENGGRKTDNLIAGSDCQQRYCCGQRNPFHTQVGVRDLWR